MRQALAVLLVAGALGWPALVRAEGPPPSTSAPSASTAPATSPEGIAVVATSGMSDATWPLAQKVYANPSLRPAHIDDARARVLAGESAPSPELSELIELRDGVKGDDAASRQVLGAIAEKLSVRALVVVFSGGDGQPPVARVFHADNRAFDAARYSPDAKGGWDGTLELLGQQLGMPPAATAPAKAAPAVTAATPKSGAPAAGSDSKSFWQSPWFWVAIGAAALIGGGVLVATSVQTTDTIHLQLRMPP
ncbi:MAG TPA: hypothetical protein VLM85_34415 [Polyangiaceae bacterium]|nr:hypothetical protein [Polyangiaceae bacterium]